MKNILLLIVVVLACAGAAMTVPDEDAHRKALLEAANSYVNDKVDDAVGTTGIGGTLGKGLKAVKQAVGAPAASLLLKQYLEVENYGLISIGKLKKGDEKTMVSVGIYGKVFTPNTEQIDEALKKNKE